MNDNEIMQPIIKLKESLEDQVIKAEIYEESLQNTKKSLIDYFKKLILKRKYAFFLAYYSKKYLQDCKNLSNSFDLQNHTKFDNIPEIINKKYTDLIQYVIQNPDKLSHSIMTILQTKSNSDFISLSFLPSLFELFTTKESCDNFIKFVDELCIWDKNNYYSFSAAKSVFVSPQFTRFVESVVETISVDLATIEKEDDAVKYWNEFTENFKSKLSHINYLSYTILHKNYAVEMFKKSFIEPALKSPLIYGLYPVKITLTEKEQIILDAFEKIHVAETIIDQIKINDIEFYDFIGEMLPDYSKPYLLTEDDILVLDYINQLINSDDSNNQIELPKINDSFKLFSLKPSGVLYGVTKQNPINTIFANIPKFSIQIVENPNQQSYDTFTDLLMNYSLPFSPEFNIFRNRLGIDLISTKWAEISNTNNENLEEKKLIRYKNNLDKLETIYNFEKQICKSRKDLLT